MTGVSEYKLRVNKLFPYLVALKYILVVDIMSC